MLGLGFRIACRPSIKAEARIGLSLRQKACLQQLLRLELKLKHPEIPDATRGLEGMKISDQILKERQAIGILIGGLSEMVWRKKGVKDADIMKDEDENEDEDEDDTEPGEESQSNGNNVSEADLMERKDVDVMVLSEDFELKKNFEGGIDWWLPATGDITIGYENGLVAKKWWRNGNGVALSFTARSKQPLDPGLYIPGPKWVIKMREQERLARFNIFKNFSKSVRQKFREALRKRMLTTLPEFIQKEFAGQILSREYEKKSKKANALTVEGMQNDEVIGIERFYGRE